MEQVVTVGLDGTAESLAAAHWAADEAKRRELALRLTHAWILLSPPTPDSPAADDQNYWAKRIVHEAHTELARLHPDLTIIEDLVAGEPEKALLDAAAGSRMLVLGSRGLDPVARFFLGDIGLHAVTRAERPVVLVRADRETGERRGRVVVGLSLHGPQDNLLEFAYVTAFTRGVPLHAVHGRKPDREHTGAGGTDETDEFERSVRRELDDVLRPWREKFPRVRVIDEVHVESPARAVVRAAADCNLLMVGRRRHPPALGPRLGPVVQAAVHHAACPVAVVPHE
ncbi:universal stress protein [Streptomyces coffeae]|uniref:Universal stress protein n=1 Tax=Streptomyces coffeae TaxID=621382 RepID=A0ABS1ND03_9ACTN|nr:universal stress protein [Streptomyces coffeae]MBL1097822.1 universal stress protein [Streptomyces coffeae]